MAEGVQFSVTFLGGIAYGFWSSWRVSLTVLAAVPFMIASTAFVLKMNQTQTARANSSYAKAGSIVYTVRILHRVGVYVSSIWNLPAATPAHQFCDRLCPLSVPSFP
jgi:ABC-type multidrug transport system fused ATPase/permease subunit